MAKNAALPNEGKREVGRSHNRIEPDYFNTSRHPGTEQTRSDFEDGSFRVVEEVGSCKTTRDYDKHGRCVGEADE